MTRNLVMFIYPRREGQKWRRAVAHIKARWSQFDGRKTIAIAHDTSTEHPQSVADEFGRLDPAYVVMANTELQEGECFLPLLRSVAKDPGITLYCHAKGSTHVSERAASHPWCDAMAAACLDYPDMVDFMLRTKSCAGAFRSLQQIGYSPSSWHYAGTWWWVRNADLFSRNWGDFEQAFWGVESYPGRHFRHQESACLFFDNAHTSHLYSPEWWQSHIGPAFRAWRDRLARCGQRPLCADPPNCELFRECTQ